MDSTRKHTLETVLSILGYFNKKINNIDTIHVPGVFHEAIFNVSVSFENSQTK